MTSLSLPDGNPMLHATPPSPRVRTQHGGSRALVLLRQRDVMLALMERSSLRRARSWRPPPSGRVSGLRFVSPVLKGSGSRLAIVALASSSSTSVPRHPPRQRQALVDRLVQPQPVRHGGIARRPKRRPNQVIDCEQLQLIEVRRLPQFLVTSRHNGIASFNASPGCGRILGRTRRRIPIPRPRPLPIIRPAFLAHFAT